MYRKSPTEENRQRLIELSTFLKELRINSGMTQQELGNDLNLHRNSISHAENYHNITLLTLFQLADAYEIRLSELFQDIK